MAEAKMETVEYIGPMRPGVTIRQGNGGDTIAEAEFGKPVDVPADVAKGLLQQPDNWRKPKPGPKPQSGAGQE